MEHDLNDFWHKRKIMINKKIMMHSNAHVCNVVLAIFGLHIILQYVYLVYLPKKVLVI